MHVVASYKKVWVVSRQQPGQTQGKRDIQLWTASQSDAVTGPNIMLH